MFIKLKFDVKLYFFRYYRGTHGVIVVYDVSNGESFANVKRWLQEIDSNCEVVNKVLGEKIFHFSNSNFCHKINFLPVGNKNDDPQRKVVLTEDAQRFAEQMGIALFETSAKDNINVEDMFLSITEKVLRHKKATQRQQNDQNDDRIKVNDRNQHKKKKRCC